MTYDEEIAEIIKEGGHNKKDYTDEHFLDLAKYMVEQECLNQGINTHFGYESVEDNEDFILYLNSLFEKIPK